MARNESLSSTTRMSAILRKGRPPALSDLLREPEPAGGDARLPGLLLEAGELRAGVLQVSPGRSRLGLRAGDLLLEGQDLVDVLLVPRAHRVEAGPHLAPPPPGAPAPASHLLRARPPC